MILFFVFTNIIPIFAATERENRFSPIPLSIHKNTWLCRISLNLNSLHTEMRNKTICSRKTVNSESEQTVIFLK